MEKNELYWDPFDYEIQADPHPIWRRMREEAPLYYNERHDFWTLTRFQDVLDALIDWRTYSSAKGDIIEIIRAGEMPENLRSLVMTDPPDHTSLRLLLNKAFTPRSVAALEHTIRGFTKQLLDPWVGTDGFDFVADFGAKLPGMVVAALLGTPESDLESIRVTTDASLHRGEDEQGMETFKRHASVVADFFADCVADRRKRPRDDMMSQLLEAEMVDESGNRRKLTDVEAVGFIHLLSAAGNETVAKFTGWAGATLATFPDERTKLLENPGLIPNAVEEILRFEPPTMTLARVVQRDVTLHGQLVPEGAVIVVVISSAGRDPRKFADPDRVDVERKIDRHTSFGFGGHVCLGVPLARLEARIVIEETLARFPRWEVDWDNCDIVRSGSAVRGYSKLPILLS